MSTRELNPITSSATNNQALETARELGTCSDGKKCGVPPSAGDDAYCVDCPNRLGDRQVVSCACGDSYPANSYGAGFIVANDGVCENCDAYESDAQEQHSKYHREIKPGVWVDCYDVLQAWAVTNPALQHLIKKALQPGERGHKDLETDMNDIIASAKRAKELEQ